MPFKSEAQRKYLWANEPEIARDWTDTYGSGIHKAKGGRIGFQAGTPPGVTGQTGGGYSDRERHQQQAADRRTRDLGPGWQTQVAPKPTHIPRESSAEKINQRLNKIFSNRESGNIADRTSFINKNRAALIKAGLIEDEGDVYGTGRLQDWNWTGPGELGDYAALKALQDPDIGYTGGYHDVNDPRHPDYDPRGGGEGEQPWLYPQGGIAATGTGSSTVADLGLGSGHYKVPSQYVVAADGGRIGLQRGGPPGGGDRGMRGTGRDYGSSYGPGRDRGWSPGAGGTQHIPTHVPTPTPRPDPTPDPKPDRFPGGGIRAINPYINVNQNRYDNQKRDWEDYLRNIGNEDYNVPTDYQAKVTKQDLARYSQQKNLINAQDYSSAMDTTFAGSEITPYEFEQLKKGNITEPGTYRETPEGPVLVAQGGIIGSVGGTSRQKYQAGNMVGAEIEGAEMEGAMMQSKEVIKELYDALIAQGLSPQEAMEKIKEILAATQAQEPEAPMMGEEFPGQEFGRAPAAFGGIMDTYTGRRKYGLGSLNPFKLVKKAVNKVKKLASSKLGKMALMYAAGTYLGGTQAFGGEGLGWKKFGARLLDPMGGQGIGNIFNPTGGLGEGKGWGVFRGAPAATSSPYLASGAAGGARLPGAAANISKIAPAVAKSDWSKYILPASVAAGLYTAEQPLGELDDTTEEWDEEKAAWDKYYAGLGGDYRVPDEYIKSAQGGRIGRQEGGLMDLGGMEKDYRDDGGFVPLGGEEKADDVPARLSRNEFVFTADAVRNAGGGDIDKGAEVMENVMKNLEAGGKVSEESQGQGAQDMFEVSERLSEVV
jgi:hypothetical protein